MILGKVTASMCISVEYKKYNWCFLGLELRVRVKVKVRIRV